MTVNQKVSGKALSMPAGLLCGAVGSMTVTIFMAAVASKLLEREIIPMASMGYIIMVMLVASSIAGAMISYRKIKRQRAAVCLLSGVIYFAALLAVAALIFGGQYESVWLTAALVFGGSIAAVLMGTIRQGRGGSRKRKY